MLPPIKCNWSALSRCCWCNKPIKTRNFQSPKPSRDPPYSGHLANRPSEGQFPNSSISAETDQFLSAQKKNVPKLDGHLRHAAASTAVEQFCPPRGRDALKKSNGRLGSARARYLKTHLWDGWKSALYWMLMSERVAATAWMVGCEWSCVHPWGGVHFGVNLPRSRPTFLRGSAIVWNDEQELLLLMRFWVVILRELNFDPSRYTTPVINQPLGREWISDPLKSCSRSKWSTNSNRFSRRCTFRMIRFGEITPKSWLQLQNSLPSGVFSEQIQIYRNRKQFPKCHLKQQQKKTSKPPTDAGWIFWMKWRC